MVTALDADVPLSECRVHEGAMMRFRRVGVGVGPKMTATHAHALDWDRAGVLQPLDHRDQGYQKMFLVPVRQCARCLRQDIGHPIAGHERRAARLGQADVDGAPVDGRSVLDDQGLALQRGD
ncbi:hypothetical protein D3C71_1648880 [compost metagenome]